MKLLQSSALDTCIAVAAVETAVVEAIPHVRFGNSDTVGLVRWFHLAGSIHLSDVLPQVQ